MAAVRQAGGHTATALLLVWRGGCDLEAIDHQSQTPLMVAATAGDALLVGLLLEQHVRTLRRDRAGHTAEQRAMHEGHSEVARLIRDAAPVYASEHRRAVGLLAAFLRELLARKKLRAQWQQRAAITIQSRARGLIVRAQLARRQYELEHGLLDQVGVLTGARLARGFARAAEGAKRQVLFDEVRVWHETGVMGTRLGQRLEQRYSSSGGLGPGSSAARSCRAAPSNGSRGQTRA